MASHEQIVEISKSSQQKHLNGRYERFNELLDRNAYKEVYKAWDTRDQIDVAWHQIDLTFLVPHPDEKTVILKECKLLAKLHHPNILNIDNVWYDDKDDKICYVTTLMDNSSLKKYLHCNYQKMNLRKLKNISKQILTGLNYLHKKSIIHGDLKCDNIFIDGITDKIVIGDLRLSSISPWLNNNNAMRNIIGRACLLAPELFNYEQDYDPEEQDIWSFGMCILELVTDTIPYQECRNAPAVYQKILLDEKKPDILQEISCQSLHDFIQICLEMEFRKRPTAQELLDHPFFLSHYYYDSVKCKSLVKTKVDQKERTRGGIESGKDVDDVKSRSYQDDNDNYKAKQENQNDESNSDRSHRDRDRQHVHYKSKKHKTHKDDVKLQSAERLESNPMKIKIKLKILIKPDKEQNKKKTLAVTFDFDQSENPINVADEMVNQLNLGNHFQSKVELAIKEAISLVNQKESNSEV